MADVIKSKRSAWACKIGIPEGVSVPMGGDSPMREAVAKAFKLLTGEDATAIFSGWGASFTREEMAVIRNEEFEPFYAPAALPAAHITDPYALRMLLRESYQHNARIEQELTDLRHARLRRFNDDECWIYQPGDDNYLGGLVCPVVISAQNFRAAVEEQAKYALLSDWFLPGGLTEAKAKLIGDFSFTIDGAGVCPDCWPEGRAEGYHCPTCKNESDESGRVDIKAVVPWNVCKDIWRGINEALVSFAWPDGRPVSGEVIPATTDVDQHIAELDQHKLVSVDRVLALIDKATENASENGHQQTAADLQLFKEFFEEEINL